MPSQPSWLQKMDTMKFQPLTLAAGAGKVHDERLRRRKGADEAGPSDSYGLPVSVSASDGEPRGQACGSRP